MRWLNPGPMVDGELCLELRHRSPADWDRGWAPAYYFDMCLVETGERVGRIDLRIGVTKNLTHYGGHIGYNVEPAHRGHHFAGRSVLLLLPLAKRHDIDPVWITCNPDNWASRRSCEFAGGKMIEIVDLPEDNDMYLIGERQKCRYRFDLDHLR